MPNDVGSDTYLDGPNAMASTGHGTAIQWVLFLSLNYELFS